MKNESNSNTALFLMELIVVIGFFSLVSVICVRLFVAASKTSESSVDLNHATRTAESMAEAWTVSDGDLTKLKGLYPSGKLTSEGDAAENGILEIHFDEDWNEIGADEVDPAFSAVLSGMKTDAAALYGEGAEGSAVTATITITKVSDEKIILILEPDHYIGSAE